MSPLAPLALAGLLAAGPAAAQATAPAANDFQARVWAASCMACHGTDGRAEGVALTLAGRSADELFDLLRAYRNGNRQGTIMQQHAKGYSEDELRRIAQAFTSASR
jgi:cytochrome c553